METNIDHKSAMVSHAQIHRTVIRSVRPPSPSHIIPSATSFLGLATSKNEKGTSTSFKPIVAPNSKQIDTFPLGTSSNLFCISRHQIKQQTICKEILSASSDSRNDYPFIGLPVAVRKLVYDYCFDEEPRKISLSPRFATKDVFPDAYFASPWDVLEPVFGGLSACPALRRELMIYFWTQFHFHVTLSPFTGPIFSPLSSVWLPEYLGIIQYISVDIDLTRLDFGTSLPTAKFNLAVHKTENLLIGIVNGLARRHGKTTIAEFNVMCRRNGGFRSEGDVLIEEEPVLYYPNASLHFGDSVGNLRGLVQKCRISGFAKEYSKRVLHKIFDEPDYEPILVASNTSAWPPLFDEKPHLRSNETLLSPVSNVFMPLPHHPSSNTLAEEIEKEMLKMNLSPCSDDRDTEKCSITGVDVVERFETTSTVVDTSRSYHQCHGSIGKPNHSIGSDAQVGDSARRISEEESRARSSGSESGTNLMAARPSVDSPTPSTHSLNAVNRMSEQDPTFLMTVDALRGAAHPEMPDVVEKARPASTISSPALEKGPDDGVRAQTSLGTHPRSEGAVRRYLSFARRLRGGGS